MIFDTNYVNNNYGSRVIFIQSVLRSMVIILIVGLFNQSEIVCKLLLKCSSFQVDPNYYSLLTVATVLIFYVNERMRYYKKWEYLTSFFNQIQFMDVHDNRTNEQKNLLISYFLHDLHLMNYWTHDSYVNLFTKKILEFNKKYNYSDEKS